MKIIKNSSILLVSSIISSGIPFLLQPVLTRVLTPSDYGYISIFQIITAILTPLIHLGYNTAIEKKFFDTKSTLNIKKLRGTALIVSSGMVFLWTSVLLLLNYSSILNIGLTYEWILLASLFSLSETFVIHRLSNLKIFNKFSQLGIFNIILSILDIGFTLILILALDFDWKGRVIGRVLAWSICGIASFLWLKQDNLVSLIFDNRYFKILNKFSLPIVPHLLSAFVINASDRIFILNMIGKHELGIYTVGYQLGMIVIVVGAAFNKVWQPFIFKELNYKETKRNRKIVLYTYYYFGFILIFAILMGLFAPYFVEYFLGDQFQESSKYILYVSLGYAFNSMFTIISTYYYFSERTKIIALSTLFTAVINLIANYILIKLNGAIGAAQATLLSFFLQWIVTWYLSNKIYPMPWRFKKY